MLLLLGIAGISIGAAGARWWSDRQGAEVAEEIRALKADLRAIEAADEAERSELVDAYLARFKALAEAELAARREINRQLFDGLQKARTIDRTRFGARQSHLLTGVIFELERAFAVASSELAHLDRVAGELGSWRLGTSLRLPHPADLTPPRNFPASGAVAHFVGPPPRVLHGYSIEVADFSDTLDGRAAFRQVNHLQRVATVSTRDAVLIEANQARTPLALDATVIERSPSGLILDCHGTLLLLPTTARRPHEDLLPRDSVDVYSNGWALSDILQKGTPDRPLEVRRTPRASSRREGWVDVPLRVEQTKLKSLCHAVERIEGAGNAHQPWRVSTSGDDLVLRAGATSLRVTPDHEGRAFVLQSVRLDNAPRANAEVSVRVELAAFVEGEDEKVPEEAGTTYLDFVNALTDELGERSHRRRQNLNAERLRKLSNLYEDLAEHRRANASVSFEVLRVSRGGREVLAVMTEAPPDWFTEAAAEGDTRGLDAVGGAHTCGLRSLAWESQPFGTFRFALQAAAAASTAEIGTFEFDRIERTSEGKQQDTLRDALESAIEGRFVSPQVHDALLGVTDGASEVLLTGHEHVGNVLRSSEPVVAVWGPPGTGKTTLLVKWLAELFDPARRDKWPRVLISAPTHVAVDKLVLDLLGAAPHLAHEVVRYADQTKVESSGLADAWHERLIAEVRENSTSDVWKGVLSATEARTAAARWIVGPRHIHAATCVGMARKDFALGVEPFDIAVVDEAGKAFGAELLIPAARARRLVLVGDHNQLPPTVTEEVLDESIAYRIELDEVEDLLRENAFRGFFENLPRNAKGMLNRQFRMHSDIGNLVSHLFYGGRVESARTGGHFALLAGRVVFVDFSDLPDYRCRGAMGSRSMVNGVERRVLMAMLERLDARVVDDTAVLVVCPYRGQRHEVAAAVEAAGLSLQVDVTTVDAVQGGEADIVFLLMTRDRGRVQFLLDRHRLNVALSRARDAVVVLGHADVLSPGGEGPIAELLHVGTERGTLKHIRVDPERDSRAKLAEAVVS